MFWFKVLLIVAVVLFILFKVAYVMLPFAGLVVALIVVAILSVLLFGGKRK